MTKNYFTIILLGIGCFVNAQIINIPDPLFKSKLVNQTVTGEFWDANNNRIVVDANNDGEIQVNEALLVETIYFNNSQPRITDMTGIRSFANLKYLYLSSANPTILDLSGLSNLIYVSVYNNSGTNNLSSIDLTGLTSLEQLRISDGRLTSIDLSGLTSLKYLQCQHNLLTSLNVQGLNNLIALDCRYNSLTTLQISNLPNLRDLNCQYNNLNNLAIINLPSITTLACEGNQLATLDLSGINSLTSLTCSYNLFSSLNVATLTSLTYLDCQHNQLAALNVSTNTLLNYLRCNNNLITALDLRGLNSLTVAECGYNQIASINVTGLNAALRNLYLQFNLLSTIDVSTNSNLYELNVNNNQLTSLNTSGLPISTLVCNNNLLTSLDLHTNTNLWLFQCNNNNLITLDLNSNLNLQYLRCNNNQLTGLFLKNSMDETNPEFSGNPNLQYICVDETQIPSIQNQITTYGYSNCHVNSYCSFTPGGAFYDVQGTTRFDQNANGCDVTDIMYPNLRLSIDNGTFTSEVIFDNTGNYTIPLQSGTYSITPILENPSYFTVSPSVSNIILPTTASPFVQDYCIAANGLHNDLEISLLPINQARPGFDALYKITYKNKGTNFQSGTVTISFDDAVLDFVVANPILDSQSVNSLSWNFTNLAPFESREILLTLNVNSPTETPAVNNGDLLNYTATVTAATDETPNDNTFTLNQTVFNSFDPNDKTCLEGNAITPEMVGQYVHYMIRFENTGTFAAENIVVADAIDASKFDINSLVPLSSSHDFYTRINGTKAELIFENISLPFDDANNDGYVAFKIKTKPTLVIGDTFSNSANIYFDYNFPIVTNTATTTISTLGTTDFEFNNVFSLSPVPAKSVLNITLKQAVNISSVSIYNALGQLVQVSANPSETIDVSGLKAGSYFIKIISDKVMVSSKFIKE